MQRSQAWQEEKKGEQEEPLRPAMQMINAFPLAMLTLRLSLDLMIFSQRRAAKVNSKYLHFTSALPPATSATALPATLYPARVEHFNKTISCQKKHKHRTQFAVRSRVQAVIRAQRGSSRRPAGRQSVQRGTTKVDLHVINRQQRQRQRIEFESHRAKNKNSSPTPESGRKRDFSAVCVNKSPLKISHIVLG